MFNVEFHLGRSPLKVHVVARLSTSTCGSEQVPRGEVSIISRKQKYGQRRVCGRKSARLVNDDDMEHRTMTTKRDSLNKVNSKRVS